MADNDFKPVPGSPAPPPEMQKLMSDIAGIVNAVYVVVGQPCEVTLVVRINDGRGTNIVLSTEDDPAKPIAVLCAGQVVADGIVPPSPNKVN